MAELRRVVNQRILRAGDHEVTYLESMAFALFAPAPTGGNIAIPRLECAGNPDPDASGMKSPASASVALAALLPAQRTTGRRVLRQSAQSRI